MAQGGGGRDRLLEIIAVLLLGLATLGTAWCGFEAAQWSGNSSDLARQASDEHVESARLFGVATQKISYDGTMVAQYALAATQGNEQLLEFYRNSLIRPDFLPVLEEWVAEVKAGQSPTPLLEDPDYLATELADYQAAVATGRAVVGRQSDCGRQRQQVRRDDHPARRRPVLRRCDVVVPLSAGQGDVDRRGPGDDGLRRQPAVDPSGAAVTWKRRFRLRFG